MLEVASRLARSLAPGVATNSPRARLSCAVSKKTWARDGFISHVPLLPAPALPPLLSRLADLEAQAGGRLPAQLLNPHFSCPTIASLCLHPALLDAMQQVLGPDLVLLSSAIFTKYPATEAGDKFIGAHQDLTYWGIRPLEAAAAWVAIDSAGPHNGSMMFLPGSHLRGLVEHGKAGREGNLLQDNQEIALTKEEVGRLVQSSLEPGEASLHHGLTVHLSPPNTSSGRRAGINVIFVTPEVKFSRLEYETEFTTEWRQPVLARGEDRFGHMSYAATAEDLLAGKTAAKMESVFK